MCSPLPSHNTQVDGDYKFDSRKGLLLWTIDMIDSANQSGSMEFKVPSVDPDSFFPVEVEFSAAKTMCEIEVEAIEDTQSGAPVKYGIRTILATDSYQVS